MKDSVTVSYSSKGDVTGTLWEGVFVAKVKLSNRDVLRQDEIYRNALGQKPGEASALAQTLATYISFLAVRLTKSPEWFREAGNGLDFEDESLLQDIFTKVKDAVEAEYDAHRKEAEEAKKSLGAAAAKIEAEVK